MCKVYYHCSCFFHHLYLSSFIGSLSTVSIDCFSRSTLILLLLSLILYIVITYYQSIHCCSGHGMQVQQLCAVCDPVLGAEAPCGRYWTGRLTATTEMADGSGETCCSPLIWTIMSHHESGAVCGKDNNQPCSRTRLIHWAVIPGALRPRHWLPELFFAFIC